ncbi:acyl carrier protein [Kitasatospora sp. NPDC096128]|uniref:acyl carrier protein n=1 Tax=Kitasatospora sp. NPDC096128 TaxID=3155547 RepID=UPI00332C304E
MGVYDEALTMITTWIETNMGLPADTVSPDARLAHLGFDYLLGEELSTAIEMKFGVDVLDTMIEEGATVGQLAKAAASAS